RPGQPVHHHATWPALRSVRSTARGTEEAHRGRVSVADSPAPGGLGDVAVPFARVARLGGVEQNVTRLDRPGFLLPPRETAGGPGAGRAELDRPHRAGRLRLREVEG